MARVSCIGLFSETRFGFGRRVQFRALVARSGKHFQCRNAAVGREAEGQEMI